MLSSHIRELEKRLFSVFSSSYNTMLSINCLNLYVFLEYLLIANAYKAKLVVILSYLCRSLPGLTAWTTWCLWTTAESASSHRCWTLSVQRVQVTTAGSLRNNSHPLVFYIVIYIEILQPTARHTNKKNKVEMLVRVATWLARSCANGASWRIRFNDLMIIQLSVRNMISTPIISWRSDLPFRRCGRWCQRQQRSRRGKDMITFVILYTAFLLVIMNIKKTVSVEWCLQ